MRYPHVESGGRYPALRTIAVLYLAGALLIAVLGVWQAVRVFAGQGDVTTNQLFGAPTTVWGRALAGLSWLAATFIAVLGTLAVAELIKLFIDIEHNTRSMRGAAAMRPATMAEAAAIPAPMGGDGAVSTAAIREGPAVPFVSDRKLFEGEETAEGALLRGH